MKQVFTLLLIALALAGTARAEDKPKPSPVSVPAGIDHSAYTKLLKKYVDSKGLVAYGKWKSNAEDRQALDTYLKQYAAAESKAEGNEKAASLINAYNAFTMQWILRNYPIESIWQLDKSFEAKRHRIGGKEVSLDDIEKGTLVPQIGWKDHGVLVCAARSCPPLRQEAYTADQLDGQIDNSFSRWMSRPDLNEFLPEKDAVDISSIFKWFKKDFEKLKGGVPKVLSLYAPKKYDSFLRKTNYTVNFKTYNWGLNDQGEHGRHYSTPQFLIDKVFD